MIIFFGHSCFLEYDELFCIQKEYWFDLKAGLIRSFCFAIKNAEY